MRSRPTCVRAWSLLCGLSFGLFVLREYAVSRSDVRRSSSKTSQVAASLECRTTREYRSSAMESRWLARARSPTYEWPSSEVPATVFAPSTWAGCTELLRERAHVITWLREVDNPRRALGSGHIFSVHKLRNSCRSEEVDVPIEPLVALLRHPHMPCVAASRDRGFDVAHVLHHGADDVAREATDTHLYMIHDRFARRGVSALQRIVSSFRGSRRAYVWRWENVAESSGSREDPRPLFNATYHDMGPLDAGNRSDPISVMRRSARSRDRVLFYVRLEDEARERRLLDTLEKDRSAVALIDDAYYSATDVDARGKLRLRGNRTLLEAYDLLLRFRNAGVRMHAWI